MSNEEIAIAIKSGNVALYSELWQNCRALLYRILNGYLRSITLPNYISEEDLRQCLYEALRAAVKSYDKGRPYRFTSYLRYSVINAVKKQLPKHSVQEISLNQPLSGDEEQTELCDLIEDKSAIVQFYDVETCERTAAVRKAVDQLPDKQRVCIELYYFEEMNYGQIAEQTGYMPDKVKQYVALGLYNLKRNTSLRCLCK